MKRETFEKILILVLLVVLTLVARWFSKKEEKANEKEKVRITALEETTLKADSLEDVVTIYNLDSPYLDVKIEADENEFVDYFEKNFAKDSLKKVVIVASRDKENKLIWHIKVKNQ